MRRTATALLILSFTAACSSASQSKRPANVPKPDVQVRVGEIFFGSGTTAPLPVDVAIVHWTCQVTVLLGPF